MSQQEFLNQIKSLSANELLVLYKAIEERLVHLSMEKSQSGEDALKAAFATWEKNEVLKGHRQAEKGQFSNRSEGYPKFCTKKPQLAPLSPC